MMQVRFEYAYDSCHPNADRIYRVDLMRDGKPMPFLGRAFVDYFISNYPQIEEGTLIAPLDEWTNDFYVSTGEEGDNRKGFRIQLETVYPNITRVFGFDFSEGDADCLKDPEKVIIPLSMAQRIFGDKSAIGQVIHLNENIWTKYNTQNLTVGGVYRDFPENTQIRNVAFTAIDNTMVNDWKSWNFYCYLLFNGKDAAKQFEDDVNRTFDFSAVTDSPEASIRLLPLTDVYFSQTGAKAGSVNTVRILLAIALLVIIIAAINYMNFSVAMTPMRIRSINVQKILGSSTTALRLALIGEALIIAVTSWLLALLAAAILVNGNMLSFFDADLRLWHHIPLVMMSGGAALLIGFAAGLYPSFYMTKFPPALVMKGSFGLSASGRRLRTALIGFQYIISFALIITSLFIQLQNRYVQRFNGGYDREQIAIVELNGKMYNESRDVLVSKLTENPDIAAIAFSKQKLGANDNYTQYTFKYLDRQYGGLTLEVSDNFLDVMDIPIIEGRNFLPSDTAGRKPAFIMNSSMQETTQMQVGTQLDFTGWGKSGCEIVGKVGYVKFSSLRRAQDNIIFLFGSPYPLVISYIKIKAGANVSDAVKHIRESVAAIDPTFPVNIEFYDQVFSRLYEKEGKLNKSISLLSLLAIIISVVGVFGLVLFETEYRRKEIGIRKVFGSTTGEILVRFNKVYVRILCICFVIATPPAWYGVHRWLENFAFKTPMYAWVYAVAFLIVLILTVATVTFQNRQAARSNPVDSIRSE
jgi:putative ABC transport system permease protein